MIRTLIVDDEPYAREELAELLGSDPDIEILGSATNAIEALGLIQRFKPDVVFLDIQMPKLSGMELVAMLDPLPRIVFVTAFDEYAIQAFEENAFDYLLKPVEPGGAGAGHSPHPRLSAQPGAAVAHRTGRVCLLGSRRRARRLSG